MTMIWVQKHPQFTLEMLGFIPTFLTETDPRPATEQLNTNYRHGGGWIPQSKFTMLPNGNLSYPGDPPLPLLAETHLRDETIRFYDCSYLVVIQPDGSFEVARLD